MHFGKIPIPTSIITVGLVLLSDTVIQKIKRIIIGSNSLIQ